MPEWPIAPETVLRTYNTDGVPASGFHNVSKSELLQLFQAFGLPLETLSADRDYYINGSTGSDDNTGATSGTAFQTPQKLANVAMGLNFSGYSVRGILAAGSYSAGAEVTRPLINAQDESLEFYGNPADPATVSIATTSGAGFSATKGAQFRVSGIKSACVYNAYAYGQNSKITLDNFLSEGVSIGNSVHVYARKQGEIEVRNSPLFFYGAGTPDAYLLASHGGVIWLEDAPMQVVTSGTVAVASAYALTGGEITAFGSTTDFSLGGGVTVTGKRHVARAAVIQVIGKTTSFFPGTDAGTTPDGGQFLTAAT